MITYLKNIAVGVYNLVKGLIITLKNIFTPAVTLQYPTQKLPMCERYRGLVDLHQEKCIACYQCVKICPTGCLALTHEQTADNKKKPQTFKYNIELCCFCGLCDQVCPTSAIYMNKIYEIAVYGHDPLHINLLDKEKYLEWHHPTVK